MKRVEEMKIRYGVRQVSLVSSKLGGGDKEHEELRFTPKYFA